MTMSCETITFLYITIVRFYMDANRRHVLLKYSPCFTTFILGIPENKAVLQNHLSPNSQLYIALNSYVTRILETKTTLDQQKGIVNSVP